MQQLALLKVNDIAESYDRYAAVRVAPAPPSRRLAEAWGGEMTLCCVDLRPAMTLI